MPSGPTMRILKPHCTTISVYFTTTAHPSSVSGVRTNEGWNLSEISQNILALMCSRHERPGWMPYAESTFHPFRSQFAMPLSDRRRVLFIEMGRY
jgi:hypothetical protein